MPIATTPAQERPRERCLFQGAQSLSLRECLAILIGSGPKEVGCMGVAEKVLQKPGALLAPELEEEAFFTALEVAGLGHLKNIHGLGPSAQAKILAAFEIGRRYHQLKERSQQSAQGGKKPALSLLEKQSLRKISTAQRCAPQEWLGFVPLLRSQKLGELCIVEMGVRTHVNTEPAELFARVLALRPLGFYLAHNHPSGNVMPSHEDRQLTQTVAVLAQALGIELLGHWIVGMKAEHFFTA